jgi:hypothetical protein
MLPTGTVGAISYIANLHIDYVMSLMYGFALLSTRGSTVPMGCAARRR